jgi:hypothetical protein
MLMNEGVSELPRKLSAPTHKGELNVHQIIPHTMYNARCLPSLVVHRRLRRQKNHRLGPISWER